MCTYVCMHMCYHHTCSILLLVLQREYLSQNPGGVIQVKLNDVVFTLHAVAVTAFTIFQCFIFEVNCFAFTLFVCIIISPSSFLPFFLLPSLPLPPSLPSLPFLSPFLPPFSPSSSPSIRGKDRDSLSLPFFF